MPMAIENCIVNKIVGPLFNIMNIFLIDQIHIIVFVIPIATRT